MHVHRVYSGDSYAGLKMQDVRLILFCLIEMSVMTGKIIRLVHEYKTPTVMTF